MGKPKFSRKRYETPSHPWQEDRIKEENELIKKYGLKNKKEIWKAQTRLKKYRSQARELLAKIDTGEKQIKKESEELLMHLNRMNILPLNSTLDDVLALNIESILSRRLQTLAYLKGFAGTPNQARQLISHGHISINGKKVSVPSYIVNKEEESDIGYISDSPLNDTMHPARPKAEYKSIPVKKDTKPKEETKEEKETKPKDEEKDKKEEKQTEEKPAENKQEKPEQPKQEPKKEEKTDKKSEVKKTEEDPGEKNKEDNKGGK